MIEKFGKPIPRGALGKLDRSNRRVPPATPTQTPFARPSSNLAIVNKDLQRLAPTPDPFLEVDFRTYKILTPHDKREEGKDSIGGVKTSW